MTRQYSVQPRSAGTRSRVASAARAASFKSDSLDLRNSRNSRDSRTRAGRTVNVFIYFHGLGNGRSIAFSWIDRDMA